jgi:hypothetical protein
MIIVIVIVVIVVRTGGAIFTGSLFEKWDSSVNVVTSLQVSPSPLLPIEEGDSLFSQTT